MKNECSNIDRLAMLFELGLKYKEELKTATENNDTEKTLQLTELIGCILKLIEDVEERGA